MHKICHKLFSELDGPSVDFINFQALISRDFYSKKYKPDLAVLWGYAFFCQIKYH